MLAHAGIKGFSTQKLIWGSSVPDQPTTPYGAGAARAFRSTSGVWVGPDGSSVIAALNPGDYGGRVTLRPRAPVRRSTIGRRRNARHHGVRSLPRAPRGRQGEARHRRPTTTITAPATSAARPTDSSVMWIQRVDRRHAPARSRVLSAKADQFFLDLTPAEGRELPRYSGEMELQNHSAGSLTSEAYQKRWIRENEILADARREGVGRRGVAGRPRRIPIEPRLNDAWTLMHGRPLPRPRRRHGDAAVVRVRLERRRHRDEQLSERASPAAARRWRRRSNTAGPTGTPVVVYNPLNIAAPGSCRHLGSGSGCERLARGPCHRPGRYAPCRRRSRRRPAARHTCSSSAKAPSVGYAVYGVRNREARTGAAAGACACHDDHRSRTPATGSRIDTAGDIASIFDKKLDKELLAAPIRLALLQDNPRSGRRGTWTSSDEQRPPRGYVAGPGRRSTVTENGPARVAVQIARRVDARASCRRSRLRRATPAIVSRSQRHRLADAGDGAQGDLPAYRRATRSRRTTGTSAP